MPEIENQIVTIDLRSEPTPSGSRQFSDLQRAQAADGLTDIGRVVLIDRCADIFDHTDLVDAALSSPSVSGVIVVLVGEQPNAPGRGEALALPPTLRGRDNAVVLWLPDPRGCLWAMGTARTTVLMQSSADPAGDSGTADLLIALSDPHVFDALIAAAQELPVQVICPGVDVFDVGLFSSDVIGGAETRASHVLAEGDDVALLLSLEPDENGFRRFFGSVPSGESVLDPRGTLSVLSQEFFTRIATAEERVHALHRRRIPAVDSTETLAAVHGAGEALAELRDRVKTAVLSVDGSDGIDHEEVGILGELGISVGRVRPRADATSPTEVVCDQVRTFFESGAPLDFIAHWLHRVASRATPLSPGAIAERVEHACSTDTVQRLTKADRVFPTWQMGATIIAAFVAGFLGCFAGQADPLVVVAVVLVVSIVTLSARLAPAFSNRSASLGVTIRRERTGILGWIVASLLGATTGYVLGAAVGLPQSDASEILGVLLAAATLILLLMLSWRGDVETWQSLLGLDEARASGHDLVELIGDVALNEWVFANPRVQFAKASDCLAACAQEMRNVLLTEIASPGVSRRGAGKSRGIPQDRSRRLGRTPVVRAGIIDVHRVVAGDILDIAARVVDLIEAEMLDSIPKMSSENIAKKAGEAFLQDLREYRRDVRERGVGQIKARSERSRAQRDTLLSELWEQLLEQAPMLDGFVRSDASDRMLQLCAPEHLLFLEGSDHLARTVRFAPLTLARLIGSDQAITWATSSSVAGSLRLVPLRESAVAFRSGHSPESDVTAVGTSSMAELRRVATSTQ